MMSFLNKLHKKAGQNVVFNIMTRNMGCKAPQKMEDYFKNKKIIVTGSCAGLLTIYYLIIANIIYIYIYVYMYRCIYIYIETDVYVKLSTDTYLYKI